MSDKSEISKMSYSVNFSLPAALGLSRKQHLFTFDEDGITFKNKKYSYKDIKSVSFSITKNSVNGVYAGTTYRYVIKSPKNKLDLYFKEKNVETSENSFAFSEIINLSNKLIYPVIASRYVKEIETKKSAKIGNIQIYNDRFTQPAWLGFAKAEVYFEDIDEYQYVLGNLRINYLTEKDKLKNADVSLSVDNAPAIPLIIEMLNEKT